MPGRRTNIETRTSQIITNVEPSIAAELIKLAEARNASLSTYVRNVLIWHLVGLDKLDIKKMAGILTGDTMHAAKIKLAELLQEAVADEIAAT